MITFVRIVTAIVSLASMAYVVLATMSPSTMLLKDGTQRLHHIRFWLPVGGLVGVALGSVLGLFGLLRTRSVMVGVTLTLLVASLVVFCWWFNVIYKKIHLKTFGFTEEEFDMGAANLAIAILALMPPVGYTTAVYAPWFAFLLAPLLAISAIKWTEINAQ